MKLATAALLLCALAHCVLGTLAAEAAQGNDTTHAPTTTPLAPNITTVAPNVTTVAPNVTTVAPNVTTVAPNVTTLAPNVTTLAPNVTTLAPNVTTVAPTTPTVVPTAAPSGQLPERHFDALSFVGGIILSLGCLAILYVGFKFYKARTERNYHTL
ncbi:unnamed protein product [Ixodes hexagonus]